MRILFFTLFLFAATFVTAQIQQPLYTLETAPGADYVITTDASGYQFYKTVSDFYGEDLKVVLDSFYLLISDSTVSYVTVKQLSDSLQNSRSGNGIFDAANNSDTARAEIAVVNRNGFQIRGDNGNYIFQQPRQTTISTFDFPLVGGVSFTPGRYDMSVGNGGNSFKFEAEASTLTAALFHTGAWNSFKIENSTMPLNNPANLGLPTGDYIGYTVAEDGSRAGQSNTGFFPVDSIVTPGQLSDSLQNAGGGGGGYSIDTTNGIFTGNFDWRGDSIFIVQKFIDSILPGDLLSTVPIGKIDTLDSWVISIDATLTGNAAAKEAFVRPDLSFSSGFPPSCSGTCLILQVAFRSIPGLLSAGCVLLQNASSSTYYNITVTVKFTVPTGP